MEQQMLLSQVCVLGAEGNRQTSVMDAAWFSAWCFHWLHTVSKPVCVWIIFFDPYIPLSFVPLHCVVCLLVLLLFDTLSWSS